AGNLPGVTQTMPLAVYVALQTDLDAAIALSVLLVLVSLTILVAVRAFSFWPGAGRGQRRAWLSPRWIVSGRNDRSRGRQHARSGGRERSGQDHRTPSPRRPYLSG